MASHGMDHIWRAWAMAQSGTNRRREIPLTMAHGLIVWTWTKKNLINRLRNLIQTCTFIWYASWWLHTLWTSAMTPCHSSSILFVCSFWSGPVWASSSSSSSPSIAPSAAIGWEVLHPVYSRTAAWLLFESNDAVCSDFFSILSLSSFRSHASFQLEGCHVMSRQPIFLSRLFLVFSFLLSFVCCWCSSVPRGSDDMMPIN